MSLPRRNGMPANESVSILDKPTQDGMLVHLKTIVSTAPELEDIQKPCSVAAGFVQKIDENSPKDDKQIQNFSIEFDEIENRISCPVANEKDCEACHGKNDPEDMMLYNLEARSMDEEYFDWISCWEWSSQCAQLSIAPLKAYLAMSFLPASFNDIRTKSTPIPEDLNGCMFSISYTNCFPFLFCEVGDDEAFTTNLYNSYRALYNIYEWMVRAGQREPFFRTIRVFSITLSTKGYVFRVHRATEGQDGIQFEFDILEELHHFTKDEPRRLIRTLLEEYAKKELLPILRSTFEEVMALESAKDNIATNTWHSGH